MKNNQEKILILLAFLPIVLFPISLPFSLLLAVGLLIYSINIVQDNHALKKILSPLCVLILISLALGTINIFFSLVHGVGGLFRGYNWSSFKNFMDMFYNILELILSAILYAYSVLIIISLAKNKKIFMLSALVEKVVNNDYSFKKQENQNDIKAEEQEVVYDDKEDEED